MSDVREVAKQIMWCGFVESAEKILREYTASVRADALAPYLQAKQINDTVNGFTFKEKAEMFFSGYIDLVRDYQPEMKPEQFTEPLAELLASTVRDALAPIEKLVEKWRNDKGKWGCDSAEVCADELESTLRVSREGK